METIDYEKVLADLETKRAAFNAAVDNAIQGIRHVISAVAALPNQSVMGAHISSTVLHPPSVSLTPDAFFGLSIGDAAVKYLATIKRQQRSREVADALEAAGYHHNSTNFTNTVNTALYRRSKDEQDVVRIGRNWALAEWYPGRRKGGSKGRDVNAGGDVPSASHDQPSEAD
jgi:hypothetical protein